MNGAMKASEGGTFEALYYKKNGHAIWLQIEITPIRNEQAVVVLFLSTYRDITIFKGRQTPMNLIQTDPKHRIRDEESNPFCVKMAYSYVSLGHLV